MLNAYANYLLVGLPGRGFWSLFIALIFSSNLLALDPAREISQYPTRLWQVEQGLPHNTILSLAQTKDGSIWCGTEKGLSRFDGTTFTIYDATSVPSIKNNSIRTLLVDRQGRLWIGTGGGGLLLHTNGTFRRFGTSDGLAGDTVLHLYEDRMGAVWIGTSTGLSRYEGGRIERFTEDNGAPMVYCRDICEDKEGRIWIATVSGLTCYHNNQFRTYTKRDGLPDNSVNVLCPRRNGGLWVGIHGMGLCRWFEGKIEFFRETEGFALDFIRAMCEDRDGNLWLGTNEGLVRWRDDHPTGKLSQTNIDGGFICSLLEDRRGNLWAGTAEGLLCLGKVMCVTHTTQVGLASDMTWASLEDHNSNLWVATTGGLSVRKEGKWFNYTKADGMPSNKVVSLAEDASGDLWVGTTGGLTRLRNNQFQNYTLANGLPVTIVIALYTDRKGNLWIGLNGGGIYNYRDGQFMPVPLGGKSENIIARSFCEDGNGTIWIGTVGNGVCALRNSKATWYTTHNGLSSDMILCVQEDAEGTIWVGTHGGGLNRFRNGVWSRFSYTDGLPDDIVYQILEEGSNLWISCSKGIYRVRKSDFTSEHRRISPLMLGKNDGMRVLDCNGGTQPAGCRTRDGHLWFPTAKGIVSIDPSYMVLDATPPHVSIEQVVADGVSLSHSNTNVVPPGNGSLEFHYMAVELMAPERVRFRYQLVGFDKEWVEAGNRRVAYYTNIPPGTYQFQVTACNGEGFWMSQPITVEVELKPHFYQTWWFYTICGALLLSIVLAGHLLRINRLRVSEELLARRVIERTAALQKEISEHARTSELLRQSQKLEAVGQLAGGIAHDFNNILTVIIGYTGLLLDDSRLAEVDREILTDMLDAGQRAKSLTHQLLAFSRRQVLEPRVLNPNTVISDLERMLRRLIGEDVLLSVTLSQDLYLVKVDLTQLQQVLLNLAVNSRDAMPHGGRFTIETQNVVQKIESAQIDSDEDAREFVCILVRDDGCGMRDEVKERLFEPFFTTKGPGLGTGLGLATVYGIVQQSGGHITVESAVGQGTEFRIFLPRTQDVLEPETIADNAKECQRGGETILLVEDEPTVRAVAQHILSNCGYHVLEAEDGESALQVAANYEGRISLLVSDVVMPNMGGRQLAMELQRIRPDIRVLLVSGYTDDMVIRQGVLELEVAFLQKPYLPAALATKVRSVLDQSLTSRK